MVSMMICRWRCKPAYNSILSQFGEELLAGGVTGVGGSGVLRGVGGGLALLHALYADVGVLSML